MPDTTVRERLEQILAPARELLAEVESKIEKNRDEYTKLLVERNELQKVIRVVDPTEVRPGPKPSRTASRNGGGKKASAENIDRVGEWIQANMTPDQDISGRDLAGRDGFPLRDTQVTNFALIELADRGLLRLDHVGNGSRKFYRLSRHA